MQNTLSVCPPNEGGTRSRDGKIKFKLLFQSKPISHFRQNLEKSSLLPNTVAVSPVPRRIAIAPDRFYINITDGKQRCSNLPIQFSEIEVQSLLPRLKGASFEQAVEIVQVMCDRGSES